MNNNRGFRGNFTWKKFLLIAIYLFVITLAVGCVWNYLTKEPVSPLLTGSALLHRTFEAFFAGFILSGLIPSRN